MRDLAIEFPTDRELLFYVADMFPADAVYPGRPFGDMTLRLLVFDYHKRGQKCLGVMHSNIVLGPYITKRGRLARHPDVGVEAEFTLKWNSLEPIKIWGDQIDPWCFWDRSFLAYLLVANFATMRQVPDVETMRLPDKIPSKRKIKRARIKYYTGRSDKRIIVEKLACLREPEVKVYWGDFEDIRSVKNWQFAGLLDKPPVLLLDTQSRQALVNSHKLCQVKSLPPIFRETKQKEFDHYAHEVRFLTLLTIALNSRHMLPQEVATLFVKSDEMYESECGRVDAFRKRIERLREWLAPYSEEFILKGETRRDGTRAGSPNPECNFFVLADPVIERIDRQEGTFGRWRKSRSILSGEKHIRSH